jgi:hypothetical protein
MSASNCLEFDYGTCVSSEFKDGALRIAPDLLGPEGSGRGGESIQPLGILFRPRDPDADENGTPSKGAGALYATLGDELYVLPTTDPRFLDKIPQVKPGGGVIYSAPGAFIYFDGETGTTQIFVPYDDDGTARTHVLTLNAVDKCVQLTHGKGHGLSLLNDSKNSVLLSNKAGDATLAVNDSGIVLNGNVTINGGIVAGNPVAAQPVMLGPDLMTWIAQVNTAMTALAAGSGLPTNATVTAPVAVPKLSTVASASPTP